MNMPLLQTSVSTILFQHFRDLLSETSEMTEPRKMALRLQAIVLQIPLDRKGAAPSPQNSASFPPSPTIGGEGAED